MCAEMSKSNVSWSLLLFCLYMAVTCPSMASAGFPADSIRVKWMEGKKFILHKVEPKETWQHLAKRYNCTISDLKEANGGVEQLKTGQIVNIPAGAAGGGSRSRWRCRAP